MLLKTKLLPGYKKPEFHPQKTSIFSILESNEARINAFGGPLEARVFETTALHRLWILTIENQIESFFHYKLRHQNTNTVKPVHNGHPWDPFVSSRPLPPSKF